jgi:hypothetical protein
MNWKACDNKISWGNLRFYLTIPGEAEENHRNPQPGQLVF